MFWRRLTGGLGSALLVVAAVMVLGFVAGVLSHPLALHARAAINTVVAMGGVGLVLRAVWEVDARAGRVGSSTIAQGVLAGVGFGLFGTGALTLIHTLFPATLEQRADRAAMYEAMVSADSPLMIVVVFVVVALLPGVFEEFVFRGVLRERLASIRAPFAHGINGAAFALIHADVAGFAPYFVVGAGLSMLAQADGGWRGAAVAHVALNALNALILPELMGDRPVAPGAAIAMFGGGLGVAAGAVLNARIAARGAS